VSKRFINSSYYKGSAEIEPERGGAALRKFFWKPERRSETSRQVEGGAPRFLPFRLTFSDKLMLNLCDFFAGHLRFGFHQKLWIRFIVRCVLMIVKVIGADF